jgi:putative membrane protein
MNFIKTRFLASTVVSLGVAFAIPSGFAADEAKSKPAKPEQAADKKAGGPEVSFLKMVASDGLAEVKLGELAGEKGGSAEVKEFGSMMVTDHGKANEELKPIASAKGVEVPAELDKKHQATHDKLAKLSGAEFDKAYISEMVKAHTKAVSEFEKAAKSKDAEVKAFADKTLPTLRHHLEKAQSLSGAQGAEKAPGKGKKGA